MKKVWADAYSFVAGVVRNRQLSYLVLSDDAIAANKTPFSSFLGWRDGDWLDAGQKDWFCAGISYVDAPERLLAVGEFGEVYVRGGGQNTREVVGQGKQSPKDRGPLRGVRRIGDRIFVVGMDRQAYVRSKSGVWSSIDSGAKPQKRGKKVTGFEAVDGFDVDEVYAVGWDGAIWRYDGSTWSECDSPAGQVLVDVCCAGNGTVYACGREGLMVSGRQDEWSVLEAEGIDDDIWSLAWFRDRLYAATTTDLFELKKNKWGFVDTGNEEPDTCYKLSVGDGVLWSIGAKDIISFDGKKWTRIE